MTERLPPPSAMCGVCNRILTPVVTFEPVYEFNREEPVGQLETTTYRHPAGFDEDHTPVPVPEDLATAVEICDCCSAPEVVGYAIATPFEVSYQGAVGYDDGQWALCSTCRAFIEADDFDAMTARAVERMVAVHGPDARGHVHAMHDAFRRAFTGEIYDDPQTLG